MEQEGFGLESSRWFGPLQLLNFTHSKEFYSSIYQKTSPYHKDQKNVSWGGDVNFSSPHGVQNRFCISQPGILYLISRYDARFLVHSYIEKAWSLSLGNAQDVNLSTLNDSVHRESFGNCSTPKSSCDCSCPSCSWRILKQLYMGWIAAYFPTFSRNGVIDKERILEWLSSKVEGALHRRMGAAQKTMRDVVQLFHRMVLYDSPMTVQKVWFAREDTWTTCREPSAGATRFPAKYPSTLLHLTSVMSQYVMLTVTCEDSFCWIHNSAGYRLGAL
ncbi:hypothetical protein XU18_4229 [Perkinsela sp. CCAP 1560/4]|nr:hypothetical protein XU18_4229 [Perkinsela sp. CCAP 1560/4]|eukprot:KNH04545.1 hypothetical protein XU18_4229 [Perkinsela sp. CCAP 1560/4]